MKLACALPAAGMFATLDAFAQPGKGRVKITAVKAMATQRAAGNCLIRVDTDAGITGYGEAGSSGPMARARIETMKALLIGQDPLAIEKHFHTMTTLMHTYLGHIPTISGIDMALWDIAGKITGQPVCVLLGGPFRDAIPMYSHGALDMLDKGSCREWAARIKAAPEGFTAFKNSIDPIIGVPSGKFTATLDSSQLRKIGTAYMNAREAVGDSIDVAVHCHNEFDTPSAINMCKAVEPMNPLFVEDPINVPFHEGWMNIKRSTRLTILTGEKLEMVSGFKPFLDNQACDIIHPDLAFAGGFTGTKKIANYAQLTRTPVALHNVGTLVLTMASAHMGSAIQNFYRSESALGRPTRQVEDMAAANPPEVKEGKLKVSTLPGIGVDLNPDYLKKWMVEGEPWWG